MALGTIRSFVRGSQHFSTYEPTLEALQVKYEHAIKDKTMVRLERDKLSNRIDLLSHQLGEFEMAQSGVAVAEKKEEADKKVLCMYNDFI